MVFSFIVTEELKLHLFEASSYLTPTAPSGRFKSAGKVLSVTSVVKAASIFFTRVLSRPSPLAVGASPSARAVTPAVVFRCSSVMRTEFAEPALRVLKAFQRFLAWSSFASVVEVVMSFHFIVVASTVTSVLVTSCKAFNTLL